MAGMLHHPLIYMGVEAGGLSASLTGSCQPPSLGLSSQQRSPVIPTSSLLTRVTSMNTFQLILTTRVTSMSAPTSSSLLEVFRINANPLFSSSLLAIVWISYFAWIPRASLLVIWDYHQSPVEPSRAYSHGEEPCRAMSS